MNARRCGCTFCCKHGGVWTSHPDAALTVISADASLVSRYRFGTGTADFLLCRVCGVPVAVVSDIDARLYAVVNVNALEDLDRVARSESATDFDAEETADRLQRRRKNWIPTVELKGL